MNYRICVLHWGNEQKYIDLLHEWFVWYEMSETKLPVMIITDDETTLPDFVREYIVLICPVSNFGPIDPAYVFDRKGALTCLAISIWGENMLIVDADAFIRKDPTPLLEPFANVPFAMPDDFGALDARLRRRDGYQSPIPKRCAGVMWFGPGDRTELVLSYKAAFRDMLAGHFQESRHLFEQAAWATVAYQTNAPLLPRTLNWADHIPRYGPNEDAAIYHRIGRRKWRKPKA